MKRENKKHNILRVSFLMLTVFTASEIPAEAYLDPGTGSYIFQIIIAFLVGSLFAVKMFWSRLIGIFKRPFLKKSSNKSDEYEQD